MEFIWIIEFRKSKKPCQKSKFLRIWLYYVQIVEWVRQTKFLNYWQHCLFKQKGWLSFAKGARLLSIIDESCTLYISILNWHNYQLFTLATMVNYQYWIGTIINFDISNYRTRVRSLAMLVTNWLTDWLTHSLTPV